MQVVKFREGIEEHSGCLVKGMLAVVLGREAGAAEGTVSLVLDLTAYAEYNELMAQLAGKAPGHTEDRAPDNEVLVVPDEVASLCMTQVE